MTQVEKAKAYDEAYKVAEGIHRFSSNIAEIKRIEEIFPALKESEDERIIKNIISWLKNIDGQTIPINDYNSALAWLEKQGEQKVANKVEPKFKVGAWVVFNNKHQSIYQVEKIEDGYYILRHTHGGTFRVCVLHDESLRLWNISDAKDGDVLYHSDSASNGIFIFKELFGYEFGEKVICYCDYDSEDGFCLGESHTCCWEDAKILHPATKEQRDLLFKKMKEAGYEWYSEKKELKKIEQKPVWSKEDEEAIDMAIIALDDMYDPDEPNTTYAGYSMSFSKAAEILKSLKDRVQPQNRWKPSDEQMAALSDINCTGCISYAGQGQELINLYNDLKRLLKE